MAIKFHNISTLKLPLSNRRALKQYLCSLFETYGFELQSLNYIFCDDAFLVGINQQFLHHNTYTDIITFPLSSPGEPITGEIYISLERVQENASIFKVDFVQELHRVIFHGTLHLCGFKDKTRAEALEMRQKEEFSLENYLNKSST